MTTIQSITLKYSDLEDRLQFDCLDADGKTFNIWVTRRFADRLIAVVSEKIAEATGLKGAAAAHTQRMRQDLTKFQLSQTRTAAVSVQAASPSWLCNTVHVRSSSEAITIIFVADENEIGTLNLKEPEARSFLEIIRKNYITAQWSLAVFPKWMDEQPSRSEKILPN